jgi:hypothetical protein
MVVPRHHSATVEAVVAGQAAQCSFCGEGGGLRRLDGDPLGTTTMSAEPRRLDSSFRSEKQASGIAAAAVANVVRSASEACEVRTPALAEKRQSRLPFCTPRVGRTQGR